ncbi:MAG: ORF6N domain-containing protein [Bacteroidetes bacterium]|nr:ORF6N domain-containing protein [Bacteroidota bacterium]
MECPETQTTMDQAIVAPENIERSILMIRGLKVILDADLAALYGVSTKALNQAIKRNKERFPSDFMFRLTVAEKDEVVTNCDHLRRLKFSPVLPSAFTEHGAIMAATVLNSARAIKVSLFVVRAFLKLREMLSSQEEFACKLEDLEKKFEEHDEKFKIVFQSIRRLMEPAPVPPKRRIGFPTSQEQQA